MYLGIVNFYDPEKKFGFISANNFRMPNKSEFQDRWLKFYFFDKLNISPQEGNVVIFDISKHNGKFIATNVNKCNISSHKKLILQYCIYSDTISVEKREKVRIINRYGKTYHYQDTRKYYSLFSILNISTYDVLETLTILLEKKGYDCFYKAFIRVVDKVIEVDLFHQFVKNNNESTIELFNRLFKHLDVNQEVSLSSKYKFLTPFSSVSAHAILKENEVKLDNQKEREYLKNAIYKKNVFDLFYDKDDKKKIREGEKDILPSFFRRMSKCALSLEQYRQQIYAQMLEKTNYIIDNEIETSKYSLKSLLDFSKLYGRFADKVHENRLLYVCTNKPLIDFLNLLHREDLLIGIESRILNNDNYKKCNYRIECLYTKVIEHFSNLNNTYLKLNYDHQQNAKDAYFNYLVKLATNRLSKIFSQENRYVRSSNELIAQILDTEYILQSLPLPDKSWGTLIKDISIDKLLKTAIEAVKNQPSWWSYAHSEAIWSIIDKEQSDLFHEVIGENYDCNDIKQVNRFYNLRFLHIDDINVHSLLMNSSIDDIADYGMCFILKKFSSSVQMILIEKITSALDSNGNFFDTVYNKRSDMIEKLITNKLIDKSQFDFLSFHDKFLLNKRYVDGLISIEQAKNHLLQYSYNMSLFECHACRLGIVDILCSYLEEENTDKALDCIRTIMKIPRNSYNISRDSSWIDYLCTRLKNLHRRNEIDYCSYGIYVDSSTLLPRIPNDLFDWSSVLYFDLSKNRHNSKLDSNKLYVYIPTYFHTYLDFIKEKLDAPIFESYIDITSFLQNNTLGVSENTIIPYIISICCNSYFDAILIKKGVPVELIKGYTDKYSDPHFLELISDIIHLEATEKHDIFPNHGDHPDEADIIRNFNLRFTTPLSLESARYLASTNSMNSGITVTTNSISSSTQYHCDDWTTSYGFTCIPERLVPEYLFRLTYLFRTNCFNLNL